MANRYVHERHVPKQGQACNHARPTQAVTYIYSFSIPLLSPNHSRFTLEASPPPIYHLTFATPLIFLLRTYSLITSSHLPYMAALLYILSRSSLGHCTSTNWLLVLWLYNITRLVPLVLLVPTITNLDSSNQIVCIVLKSVFKNNHQRSSRLKIRKNTVTVTVTKWNEVTRRDCTRS